MEKENVLKQFKDMELSLKKKHEYPMIVGPELYAYLTGEKPKEESFKTIILKKEIIEKIKESINSNNFILNPPTVISDVTPKANPTDKIIQKARDIAIKRVYLPQGVRNVIPADPKKEKGILDDVITEAREIALKRVSVPESLKKFLTKEWF